MLFRSTIASGISSLLAIAGEITVLVVVATVVRRHRPDAYRPLLWWSIGALVMTGVNVIGYPLLAVVLARAGTESYLKAMSVWRIVSSLAYLGLTLVLVRGLVAVAQPPKAPRVESDAPYR